MTAEDLWQEYRAECCTPALGETSEEISLQRMIFLAGVTSAIVSIHERPSCFQELSDSLVDWLATEEAERN
jgi:hypothetical protein